MLTSLGKYLRKMRIDRGELLKDMADRLGMSSAMLSSIENGKRNPAPDFPSRVAREYGLSGEDERELSRLVAENSESVSINLGDMRPEDQHLAFAFARRFCSLSDDEKDRIKDVLNERDFIE